MPKKVLKPNIPEFQAIFSTLNADKSGAITREQLFKGLQKLGIKHIDMEAISKIADLTDFNDDGMMQFDEFVQFLYIIQNADPNDIKSILYFATDTNYSNTIDRSELEIILVKLQIPVNKTDLDEIMKDSADNKDGTISYDTFLQLFDQLML